MERLIQREVGVVYIPTINGITIIFGINQVHISRQGRIKIILQYAFHLPDISHLGAS